jgi:phospholipid/cholesterol/gamma-HCH transport system substrate-binding protein
MPRTRSLAWSELKLGILTIVAMGIATIAIVMLTGTKGFFWQQYTLKTRFNNVAGLKPGSPVRIAGIPVGSVGSWDLVGDVVEVTFNVNKERRNLITNESEATLGSISLLGEASVDIKPATHGTPIPEYGYVPTGKIPAQIADVADQASTGIQELNMVLKSINSGKGTVGKLMTDDSVYTELQRSVTALGDVANGIKEGKGAAGLLLSDKATAAELDRSLKNLESVTAQLNSGKGSLGMLMNDDSFARSLSSTTDSLQALAAKINRGEGTAGKLLNDTALYDKLTSISSRLDDAVAQLNKGDGTVGLLLKDRQLYENMNKSLTEFSSFLQKVESDPNRYLHIKVSIF